MADLDCAGPGFLKSAHINTRNTILYTATHLNRTGGIYTPNETNRSLSIPRSNVHCEECISMMTSVLLIERLTGDNMHDSNYFLSVEYVKQIG